MRSVTSVAGWLGVFFFRLCGAIPKYGAAAARGLIRYNPQRRQGFGKAHLLPAFPAGRDCRISDAYMNRWAPKPRWRATASRGEVRRDEGRCFMAIMIKLPADIEEDLRHLDPRLDDHARDQFLLANYQAGKLSTGEIAIILGFPTRFQAEEWLAERGACQNYSAEDLRADHETLERILGPVRR